MNAYYARTRKILNLLAGNRPRPVPPPLDLSGYSLHRQVIARFLGLRLSATPKAVTGDRADKWAKLTRLLEVHPDVRYYSKAGTDALIKKDELLVLGVHADAVHESARRWIGSREDHVDLGVARLFLKPGAHVDVADLVHDLRSGIGAHGRLSVSPNHILLGCGQAMGGPFGTPSPVGVLPRPVAVGHSRRRASVALFDTGV
jgi:hypothetical protein